MIPKIAPNSTALNVNSGRFAASLTYGRNSPIGAVEFQFGFVGSVFGMRGKLPQVPPGRSGGVASLRRPRFATTCPDVHRVVGIVAALADDARIQRRRRRRQRTRQLEDDAARVADHEELAVAVDAERADVAQLGGAAEFGRVFEQA